MARSCGETPAAMLGQTRGGDEHLLLRRFAEQGDASGETVNEVLPAYGPELTAAEETGYGHVVSQQFPDDSNVMARLGPHAGAATVAAEE